MAGQTSVKNTRTGEVSPLTALSLQLTPDSQWLLMNYVMEQQAATFTKLPELKNFDRPAASSRASTSPTCPEAFWPFSHLRSLLHAVRHGLVLAATVSCDAPAGGKYTRIVGFCWWGPTPGSAPLASLQRLQRPEGIDIQIDYISIHPDYRRQGLGRELVLIALRAWQTHLATVRSSLSARVTPVAWTARETPANAQGFWQRLGFHKEDDRWVAAIAVPVSEVKQAAEARIALAKPLERLPANQLAERQQAKARADRGDAGLKAAQAAVNVLAVAAVGATRAAAQQQQQEQQQTEQQQQLHQQVLLQQHQQAIVQQQVQQRQQAQLLQQSLLQQQAQQRQQAQLQQQAQQQQEQAHQQQEQELLQQQLLHQQEQQRLQQEQQRKQQQEQAQQAQHRQYQRELQLRAHQQYQQQQQQQQQQLQQLQQHIRPSYSSSFLP